MKAFLQHFGQMVLGVLHGFDRLRFRGSIIHNGVVVLEGGSALPEGAAVTISYPALPKAKRQAGCPETANPGSSADHPHRQANARQR